MRKLRKWSSAVMAGLLIVSSFAASASAQTTDETAAVSSSGGSAVFKDIQGNWAQSAIERWQKNGIVSGFPDGTFRPNEKLTRAEFVKVLNRVFGFKAASGPAFADVPASSWYSGEMAAARAAGYYQGAPGNLAKGEETISRQDAATLLARVFDLIEPEGAEGSAKATAFKDSDGIAPYARTSVSALTDVVKGYPDGTFRPKDPIARAELAGLLDKLVAGYNPAAGEFPSGTANGHVVVNRPDVELKDLTIAGNLYLAPGIGDGDAALDHVSVKGRTYVAGGGENTVHLKNSSLSSVSIDRKDGKVRVLVEDGTQAGRIRVAGDGKFQLGTGTKIEKVEVGAKATLIIEDGAAVGELSVGSGAAGASLTIRGDVAKLTILADGVTLNGQPLKPGTYQVAKGVLATGGNPEESPGSGSGIGGGSGGGSGKVDFVDSNATEETRALFAYLNGVRGKEVLFGHQHATDEGMTLTGSGVESDVNNSVGDFPAVFGWDTLSLEGKEKPGVANDPQQSIANLVHSVQTAHDMGGIVTLSSHMPNFVTGGSFNDTAGSVVQHVLPGGDKNEAYNAFLDNIAEFASQAKDEDGKPIPILFRPFHEQNGGWFWWGAKTTTTSEYVEIYRYTVEYLRDIKGVHNFLYVFSPNGTFGGSESSYLTTYPGDDYVDVLGMDQYDSQSSPGTESFLNGLVADLAMISKLADRKGKIATFSEFGYSPQGMLASGNGDLNWFTHVLDAIKADKNAKRISYMLTWANFGVNSNNLFVPYKDAPDGLGDHELLPDFIDYYNDPYTAFLRDVEDVYKNPVQAAAEKPFLHIVSPTDNGTVSDAVTTIRARILNSAPTKVVYSVEGSNAEIPMSLDSEGFYYLADWAPDASFNGKTAKITVKAYLPGGKSLVQQQTVFVKIGEILMKQYTFDSDTEGMRNNGSYPDTLSLTIEHGALGNNGALKLNVQGADHAESWQELKLAFPDWDDIKISDVKRIRFDAWIPSSAGSEDANASLMGVAMLAPDWNTKYGSTSELKLADLPKETIDGVEYAKYSATIDLNDPAKSAEATTLALSLVGRYLELSGAVYVDNIRLYSTYAEVPQDPALVDDFESYQGSDAALAAKFVHAGGDATTVTLDGAHKSGGTYGMKFGYSLAGSGYAGISKALGGVDWSGFNRLKFWLVPDGKNQKMVVQLKVDGIYYEAYPSLATTNADWVSLHFNDFNVAPWDTANAGKKLNKVSLKNVQEISFYVNAVSGATLGSALYLDDIKAIDDGTGGVPNGGDGPGGSQSQPGTLYGFETDASGFAVEVNQASATAPEITTEEAAEGTHSLKSTFSLEGTGFELTKASALDLSAVDAISVKVKLSAGTANARLYIKTGSAWTWHDSGVTVVDSAGFATLTIPLAGIENLDAVQSIGIKIEPAAGQTGSSTVYVDDIHLSGAEPAGMAFGFETSTEDWAINLDDSGAYNTANAGVAQVSSDAAAEGEHSLRAAFELGGGQFQIRNMVARDLSSASSIVAKVKIAADEGGSLGSGVKVKLFLQSGSGWTWADSGEIAYTGDGFAQITFDISGIATRNLTKAIGIQVLTPADSTGTAAIYLDDVKQS
ncbi:glycosyl hydrolase [Cohnella sp. AR92]|uniref:glycosyl hydrolase n=1 Tax=Cohnella sp. AR92 TaxID=648716 RepID=UPI000F8C574E|nr:glycosyl hydrolase [Cohnella sp. AR92]RUS45120.1 beta-mannosidase [Cohnella sp. AR92]